MDRQRFFHPPQRLHWVDAQGGFHLVPLRARHAPRRPGRLPLRRDPRRRAPAALLRARRRPTRLLGLFPSDRHLFGVDAPGRVYLLGTDSFGRDEFSRLLYGSQISLTVGLVGIAISFTLGLLLGGVSGYFGGCDRHDHHADDRAAAQHPVALSDHRAARRLPDRSAEPAGLSRHRRDPGVHRLGGSRARHPRPGAVDPAQRVRHRRRGARRRPLPDHRAPHPAEHVVVRHRGRDHLGARLHPRRGRAVVSRRRRAGAGRLVGQHAEPGAQHPRADVVPVAAVRRRRPRSSSR